MWFSITACPPCAQPLSFPPSQQCAIQDHGELHAIGRRTSCVPACKRIRRVTFRWRCFKTAAREHQGTIPLAASSVRQQQRGRGGPTKGSPGHERSLRGPGPEAREENTAHRTIEGRRRCHFRWINWRRGKEGTCFFGYCRPQAAHRIICGCTSGGRERRCCSLGGDGRRLERELGEAGRSEEDRARGKLVYVRV